MLAVTVERLAKRRGLAQPGRPTPRLVSVMQTLFNANMRSVIEDRGVTHLRYRVRREG